MRSAFSRQLAVATWPWSLRELTAAGVKPSTLRGPRWRSTSRGFYVPADTTVTPTQRILDVAPLIPATGALSGWAAAYVLGVDALDGLDPFTMDPLPLRVNLGGTSGRVNQNGIVYVRDRLSASHRLVRHRLAVTTPARTAFDGARWAADLVEAVVFLDMVAHALELDLAKVRTLPEPAGWWRGAGQAREALAWADARSASPWESRLRMFYRREAGLPRPAVNVPIFDLDERFLGIADLFDEEAGLVTEFDGQDHRKRRQHRADNLREEELEGVNLTVSRVDSLDMRQPVPLAERLRARRAQGMRRDRRHDRWTLVEPAWWRRRQASSCAAGSCSFEGEKVQQAAAEGPAAT